MSIDEEIEKLELKMSIAEKWFNDNANAEPKYWDMCFNKFVELIHQRANLHLVASEHYQVTKLF